MCLLFKEYLSLRNMPGLIILKKSTKLSRLKNSSDIFEGKLPDFLILLVFPNSQSISFYKKAYHSIFNRFLNSFSSSSNYPSSTLATISTNPTNNSIENGQRKRQSISQCPQRRTIASKSPLYGLSTNCRRPKSSCNS